MQILNYAQLARVFGSAIPPGGPITGRAVLTTIQAPGFPGQQYGGPYYGWPSDQVLTWLGRAAPTVTGLTPASAKVGDAAFTLHVMGTGFVAGSVIVWNGTPAATTYVSATELTTAIPMTGALVPAAVPVAVQIAGAFLTNTVTFDLQPAAGAATSSAPPAPPPPVDDPTYALGAAAKPTKRR